MKKWMGAAVIMGFVALLGLTTVPNGLAADSKKEFVGSEKCKACHGEEFKSWKESFHSKMVQPRKGGILKEAVEKWKTDGAGPGPTKGNVTGAPFTLEDVQFVIGSRWKQRFLVKNEQ